MSTENETTTERLRKLLSDQLNVRESDIQTESSIGDDLGADSLDKIELLLLTEEEFGIEINDGQWDEVETFEHALELIEALDG